MLLLYMCDHEACFVPALFGKMQENLWSGKEIILLTLQ